MAILKDITASVNLFNPPQAIIVGLGLSKLELYEKILFDPSTPSVFPEIDGLKRLLDEMYPSCVITVDADLETSEAHVVIDDGQG